MDAKWLLFRFQGRSGRARYWLATLIILGSMISALLLLAAVCLGFGIPTGPLTINLIGISASFQLDDDDAAAGLFPHLANILLTLGFAWFYAAASIRRLHDRNKSGWWLVPFMVATGLYSEFGARLGGSWAAVAIGIAVYIAFIWGLVEMYFRKGDTWVQPVRRRSAGASRYGTELGSGSRVGARATPRRPTGRRMTGTRAHSGARWLDHAQ